MVSPKWIDISSDIYKYPHPVQPKSDSNHVDNFQGNYNDFFHQYLITNRPVVISNVTVDWRCSKLWIKDGLPNIDYLKHHYGNAVVSVADCSQKYFNAQLKKNMKFHDFADYWNNLILKSYPLTEPCLYLKDWHFTRDFPNENMYDVPSQFCSDWLNEYLTSQPNYDDDYRFVYMGPKGSWTPFHADVFTSYSWSVNVCGEKRWILLEPGEENKLKDKLGNLPYDISFLEDANNNACKLDVNYKIIVQKPGDAVFVPSGWHHQVWNTRDTISINHNWINGSNIECMWRSLKTSFDDVKNEILEFQDTMDDWPSHCQLLLKSCFGMDFKDYYEFIKFIILRRKHCIETKTELKVYGNWSLSLNHIEYDLAKARNICDIFMSDSDVQTLFEKRLLQ